ncbi:hypothetical protein PV326_010824, partial [Microctonus aethiopoides]
GQSRAVWEDVTGSTPLTFVKDCVSFTTTVSARFWLMDCRNISEATRMATELYTHATHVPFMAKFVVFAKRVDPLEARLRVFCMTDDKEDKTLEHQEHFTEVAKSRDVEVLEGKTQYMEFAGNLVPVMKSGEQLQLPFRAFKENRVPFTARIKDPDAADMVGRIVFMSEPKVAKGEPPQTPICTLNILLPEKISPETGHSELDLLELSKNYSFLRDGGISRPDTIHRATIRLTDIANLLDRDWEKLAEELNISPADVDKIKSEHPGKPALQAATMFKLWQSNGNKATAYENPSVSGYTSELHLLFNRHVTPQIQITQERGNTLEKALNKIGREDIVKKCIFNVELVTDDVEKAVARVRLDQPGFDSLKEELGPSRDSSLRRDGSLANQKHDYDYDGQDLMRNSGSIDDLSNVGNVPHKRTKQQHITITNGTVFNGTSTPIKDKYASEEKEIADDMAEFLEYKCHVTDTMTKRTRDETDDDNKNRQRVIEDANRLVSGVIQDAEKEKEILAMEGLSGVYRDAGKEAEGALGQRDNESLIQSIEGTMLKDVVDSREASIEPLIKKERVVIDDSRGGKIISKTIVTTSKDHPNSASIVTKTTTVKETLTPGQINFFGVNDPVIGLETIEQQTLPSIDVSDVMTKTTVRSSGPTIEEKVITMSKSIVDKPEVQTVAFVANVPTDRAKVKAEGITRVAIDPVTMPADDKRTSEKEKLSKEDKEVADKTPKSKSKGKVNESKKDISSSKLGKDPKKIEGEPKKSAYDGVYNISSEQTKDDGKKKGSIFGGIFKNPKLKKGKSKDSKETSFDSGDEEVRATTREFLEDTRKIADQSMPAVSPTYPEFDSTKLICICPTKLPEQEPHRDPIWATADFLYDSRRSAEAFIPEAHEPKIKPANGQSELVETDGVITTDKKPESQDASEDLDEPKEKHNFFSNLFKGTKKAESDLDTVTQEVSKSADLIDKKNIKKVEDVEEKVVNGAKDNIKSAKNATDTKARKLDESINKTKDEVDTAVLKSAVVVEDVKNSIRDKGNTVNVDLKRASKEIKSPEDVKRSNEKTKKLVTTSSEDNKPESLALKTDIGDTSDEAKEKSGGFFGIFKSPKSKDKRRSTSKDKDTSKDISFDSGDEELRIATAAFLEDTKRASDKMFEPNISKNLPQEQKKVEVEKFVTSITVNSDVPKDKLKGTSYSVEESPIKNDTNVTTITTTTVTTTKLIDYRKDSSPTPEVTEGIPKVRDTARTAESMEKKEKRKSSDFEDSGDESKHRSNGFFGIFKSPKLKNKIKSRSRDRSTSKEPSFDSGDEELRQATSKFLEDTRKTAEITGSFDASETKPLKDPGVIETTPVSDPIESKNIPVADQLESKTTGQEKGGIFGIFKSPKSNVRSRSKSKEKSPPTVDNDEVELRIATAKFLEDTKNISAIMEEYPYPSAPLAPECEKVIEVKSESQVEGQDDKPGKANEKGGFLSGIFKSAKHAVDEVTEDVKEFWDETKEEAKNEEEKVERVAEQTAEDIKHGVPAAVRSAEDKVSKTILETKKAVDNDVELAKSQAKEKLIDGKDTVVKVVKATEDKVVGEVENAVKVGGSLARNIEDEVKMVKDSADKEIQKDTKDAKDKIAGAAGKVTDTAEEIKDKAEKEGKKIKDKSKGFFSGIFKGGKQATDEVVDDVTKLVDDTKKKVEKEEENIKRTTEDVKNSITEEVKIKQEKAVKKFTNGVDDVHHQLVSDKDAVIDAAKRQSESVSNVVTVASKAAEDAGKTIDQELKDDIKLMKQKVTDVSETVIDNAELAKDRVDKEKKKTKEKGKSFFSGLFKGVKNAADEVAEDIKDFVDETKDEALEEEKQFHRTVEGTAQVIGDTKDKIATDIKTNLVNFAEDAEKAKDTAGKKLATTKETVSDTVTSTVATVSDATTRTTLAAKDTAKTISEDVEKVKDDLEKELKKDSKLVTDKLGEVTESISDSAEAARIEMENQAKALTNEAHSVSDKITENVSNAAKTVDETACKIVEDVNKTKDVTIKKITDDKEKMATAVKGKIKDEVKTVVDGTETVKHKIEKEAKSTKEAGKGFFSGLFKGVKHTADEVAEEFHDFVDETKKEALKEEERTKHTAAETVQAAKDIKDNVVTDVKTNVEKMAVDTAKVKDKGQEILVASKIAITDTAKSSGAALSDAGKKTSRAAQDVTKKIDNQIEAIKDTVDAEMKKDVKFVEDKLASASESIVDGAETTKNAAEQQLESLKNKTNDTTEKIMEDVSKTAKAIEKKSDDVATNVDEVRKAAIKKTHDDIKTIEGKVSDGAKAIVDSAEVAKQKIDKDAKKAKEKGKSFFSGIFKGSKHSTDETADVKDFLDEFKREASDEKAQSIMDAEEKLLSGNDRKSGTSNVVTETVPSTTGEKTKSLNEDVVQKLDDAAKEIENAVDKEVTVSANGVSKDAADKEAKKGKARGSGFFSGIFKGTKQTSNDIADDVKDVTDEVKKEVGEFTDTIARADAELQSKIGNGKEAIKLTSDAISNVPTKAGEFVKKTNDNLGEHIEHTINVINTKVIDNEELAKKTLKQESEDLKAKVHDTEAKLAGDARKVVEVVDKKTHEVTKAVDETEKAVEKKLKEDVKTVKDKVSDGTKAITDSAEAVKHKTEKEAKKAKEKGKSFFSGIFKGGKQISDDITDDVKESSGVESVLPSTAAKAAKTAKNIEEKTTTGLIAEIDRVGDNIAEGMVQVAHNVDDMKNATHDKVVAVKETISDKAETTGKTIADTTKTVERKIIGSVEHGVDTINDTTKNVIDGAEKAKDAIVEEVKEDVKQVKGKDAEVAEATVETATTVKAKADKEVKKTKEKGKGFFSGILKGVKHATDEVAEDVKDFVDDTKREALEEEQRLKQEADELNKTIKHAKDKTTTGIKSGAEKVVDSVEEVNDKTNETLKSGKNAVNDALAASGSAISKTAAAADQKISDMAAKTSQVAEDITRKGSKKMDEIKKSVDEELTKDTKLVGEKLAGTVESVDNKGREIIKDLDTAKNATITELKDDVKIVDKKIRDGAEAVVESVENTKNKAEKEGKKAKEASKGFFSGLFKGVKHAADEVVEDVKDFVDETKKEALEEEERAKQAALDASHAIKDTENKVTTNIKAGIDKIADDTVKAKDKAQEKIVSSKNAASSAIKSADETIANTAAETSEAAKVAGKNVGEAFENAKDIVRKEVKDDTKIVTDKLNDVATSIAESADAAKVELEQQAKALKDNAHDAAEKIALSSSKVTASVEKKACEISEDFDKTKTNFIQNAKDDVKHVKEKISHETEAAVDLVETTKHKADKEAKKAKDKGKGLFSGIFKGVKHTADKVTDDVKNIVDETKAETQKEKERAVHTANEAAQAAKVAGEQLATDIVIGVDKVVGGAEKAKDNAQEHLVASEMAVADTIKASGAAISDTASKTAQAVKDAGKKVGADSKLLKDAVDKEIKQDTGLITDTLNDATESLINGAKTVKNDASQQVKALKKKAHDEKEKVDEEVSKVMMKIDDKADEVANDVHETKESIIKGVKGDVAAAKEKISDEAKTFGSSVEATKHKAEKDAKKTKEKGKSLFSGIFKSAKHTADKVGEDIKDFVDETKEQARKEEQIKDTANDAAQVAKNAKDKLTSDVTAGVEKIADGVEKAKDKTQEKLMSAKVSIADAVESTTETISDARSQTAQAARDTARKIEKDSKEIKDAFDKEVKKDTALVADSLVEKLEDKTEKDAKKTKDKTAGTKQASNETVKSVTDFLDEERHEASEEITLIQKSADDLAESVKNDIHSGKVKEIEKIPEKFIKSTDDVVDKVVEDIESTKKKITEESKKDIEAAKNFVEAGKQKTEKEVKKGKEKSSGFFSGIIKGAKHAVDEVSEDVKEFWDETKEQAQDDEQKLKVAADHAEKTIKDAESELSVTAQTIKDNVSEEAMPVIKTDKSKISGGASSAKAPETMKSKIEKEAKKDNDTGMFFGILRGTKNVNDAVTDDVKELNIREDVKNINEQTVVDIKAAEKKTKEKSSGFFSGIIKGAKHAVDEVSEEVKEFWDETKHEAKDEENRAKHESKDLTTKILKNDKTVPDFVEDEEVIRQQMTADLEQAVQHSADSSMFYTEIPLRSPSHDSVQGKQKSKVSPDKSKGNDEKSEGFFSSLGKGAKSATSKIKKEVDHTSENIKDAAEKFWEDTKYESQEMKASGSYNVSSPLRDIDSPKTHEHDSDDKLGLAHSSNRSDRESPKEFESKGKSVSRIQRKMSPTNESSKVKEINEVRVVRIEGGTSSKSIDRLDDNLDANKLGHLEPHTRHSVTTVITKSVRTAAAIPPPSPDEFGDITIKDVTEEATKRAQILADQALAAGKPGDIAEEIMCINVLYALVPVLVRVLLDGSGHDSAEIDGTVERHVTSALTKQPVPAPRHSVKSSSLSSSVNKPELTLDLEANHLTLHQHQHKSKSPKSKIPELTKFSLKSRPATSLDSSCSDELSQKSRIPVKTVREKTTFNTTKEEFAVTKEAESGKLITNVEDINDTTAIVSDLLPVNEIDRVTSMKTITTTTTTVTQGLTDPSIDMEKLQDLMETSGYNMKITTTTVTQQTSSLQSKDDKINEENTSDITLKEKIQSISTKSSWESSTKSHDDQDNWDRAQFSMDMSPSSGEAGFAKNGDSRHDLPSDSDSEGSPRPRRRSLSKRRTIGSSSGSDVALHEGAELSPLEDDQAEHNSAQLAQSNEKSCPIGAASKWMKTSGRTTSCAPWMCVAIAVLVGLFAIYLVLEPRVLQHALSTHDPRQAGITRTTRTITSSGTSGGGTEDSNDLKDSMQKIVDQFMTEERRAQ